MPAAPWEWNCIGWAPTAFGSAGTPPGALPITALTSTVPKASSRVPQGPASASAMSPRYRVGTCIQWWSHRWLRQDWSLLSVPKKYIQVQQVMTFYLKLTLNSVCQLRLRALTLSCYVGRSKRVWHFYILQDSGCWEPQGFCGLWCFIMIWFGDTLSSLSLSSPSEKGPDACCWNPKADLKWFSALRFGDRFLT